MENINLNDLENFIKRQKLKNYIKTILAELYKFSLILVVISIIGVVFVNFELFKSSIIENISNTDQNKTIPMVSNNIEKKFSIINIKQENIKKEEINQKQLFEDLFEEKLKTARIKKENDLYKHDLEIYLNKKVSKYSLTFNTLPPHKRLLISKISVDAPIQDVLYKTTDELITSDYDNELFKGVVKYPFSPNPELTGNMLIFGHTSYYWWKKNPYGQIFSKIRKLKNGDNINILREGSNLEYEVQEVLIRSPKLVKETLNNYNDGKYLTLMGCYPIGSDRQRILIIAKRKETPSIKLSLNK